MRYILVIAALLLAAAGVASGQGKSDSPSQVLALHTEELARCLSARGLVKLTLRLDLDQRSHVEKVAIESDTALSKGSRRCLERVALQLSFAPELAGKTIEHDLQVVNVGGRRARR
jgi:hypothetical protein